VVEVVASGLEVPWEIRFLPGGDLLVTERPGRITRIAARDGSRRTVGTLPVTATSESGLMGLDLDPGFPEQPYLYVAYTYSLEGELVNRVSRLTYRDDRLSEERVLVDRIPGAPIHDGARVGFGPDGFLWVTTGDAARSERAQDRDNLAGKVLRMTREGRPAPGNPFPDSLVYSYGHRNPQGLDWLPGSEVAYVTEHGPSDNDEVNRLQPGGNYGWPTVGGAVDRPGFVDPLISWTPTIAIAGAQFYDRAEIPGWRGSLLSVALKGSALRRLSGDTGFTRVTGEEVLFEGEFGRLRALRVGPDGWVYVSTSNRDGRGGPAAADDRILRIRFRGRG